MTRSNRRKRTVVLWALGLVFFGVGMAGAAQPAAGDPLQFVPAESLFCIKINNLNATLGQMDQFLTGISPVSLSMQVRSKFAKILGSPDPNSINMSGNFAVFGPLPGGDAPNPGRIGILVPVSDYQKFLKSNPNVTPPDAQGISGIGPEGQPMLIAANVAGYALVTGTTNRQALAEMKNWIPRGAASLGQRLGSEEAKRAQGSPVWAYANIQTVQKMFGPMIQAKIQQAKEGFKQMQGQPMMGQTDAMVDMYATLLNTLMQETQFVSLSLNPSAAAINAGLTVAAVPETEMAKILKGDTTGPDRSFLRYLRNEAVGNFLVAVDTASWNRINNIYIDLLAKLTGKDPAGPEVSQLRKLATEGTNAMGGTLAASFSMDAKSKPPFVLRYVVGIKDPQAFSRVMDETSKLFNTGLIADFYKAMGMKVDFELQRKVETYKDVPIDAIKFSLAVTDPNSQQGQMISAIYGQGINGRLAMVNNLLVYAIAPEPEPILREMIDQVKAGGSTQQVPSEVQAALQLIPGAEKADFFATWNYLRLLQTMMAIMPMPIPPTAVKSQSNIAIAGGTSDGRLAVQVAIPKQHLQEIMAVFTQMQQQKPPEMQKQQQNQQGQM